MRLGSKTTVLVKRDSKYARISWCKCKGVAWDAQGRRSPPRYLPAGESQFGKGNEDKLAAPQGPRFGRHGLVSNPEDLPAWQAACQKGTGNAAAAVEGAAFSRQVPHP